MKKRVLSAVMALVMLTTMLPVQALAAELDSAARADSASQTETAASASVAFVPVEAPEDEPADEPVNEPVNEPVDEVPQAPAASAAPVSDTAPQADTTSGDFTYTTSNGAVTITGYTGSDTEITIPSTINDVPVTAIGGNAFKGNTTLTSVTLPEGITTIGGSAFYGCTALASIVLPEGLKTVGDYIFKGCTALTALTIPASLEKVDSARGALSGSSVKTLTLAEGTTRVPDFLSDANGALTSIIWPKSNTITAIGKSAFAYCGSLTSVELPDSVTELGDRAFIGCSALERVTMPGVTSIGSSAFNGCTALSSVAMPEVETIGGSAFKGCAALSGIVLPEGLKTINEDTFGNCTSLKSLTIPASLETATTSFHGPLRDSAITTITFAEGTTRVPNLLCDAAQSLTTIKWPEGNTVKAIGERAFALCTSLTSVDLPDSVTSIDKEAFDGCTALELVAFPGTECTFGTNAFRNAASVAFYCPKLSDATVYAIQNGIPFQIIDGLEPDYSDYVVDMGNSQYYTASNAAQLGAYVTLTFRYALDEDEFDALSNCNVVFMFTSNLDVATNTVYLDGVPCSADDITLEQTATTTGTRQTMTVPIKAQSGTIRFSVSPTTAGQMASTAQITYTKSGVSGSDLVDVICLDGPMLKINAPSQISSSTFEVTGLANAGETVALTISGTAVGTATAAKDGTFSVQVTLPDTPVEGKVYTVKATLAGQDGDEPVSASSSIMYSAAAPKLTQFDMHYYGHDLKCLDLLAPQITVNQIWPAKPLKFVIHFDNADRITEVVVASTKNGVISKMKAHPTENKGEYIAEGFFVEGSDSYIPGTLQVLYSVGTTEEEYISELCTPIAEDELPDAWKDSTRKVITDTDEKYQAQVSLTNNDKIDYELQQNVSLSELSSLLLSSEDTPAAVSTYALDVSGPDDWEAVKSFFKDLAEKYKDNVYSNAEEVIESGEEQDIVAVIKDDTTQKLTYVFWDSAKEAFVSAGIKFLGTNWLYEAQCYTQSWAQCSATWGALTGITGTMIKSGKNMISIDDAEHAIRMDSSLTPEQKAYAEKKLENLKWGYAATLALRLTGTAAGVALTAAGKPITSALVKTTLNLLADLGDYFIDKAVAYYAAGGQGSFLQWIIDPSGVIYDAETGKPIKGAAATACWIPYSENQDHTSKPGSDEYGTKWDTSGYSQKNPIMTDSSGSYAWNTPEGWWRVKAEKDGYHAGWSQWLPVPPEQTDVNIYLARIYYLGDTNGDGGMNATDLQCLYEYLTMNTYNVTEKVYSQVTSWADWQTLMLDINCDGSIDVYDLQRLYEAVSGINGFVKPDEAA